MWVLLCLFAVFCFVWGGGVGKHCGKRFLFSPDSQLPGNKEFRPFGFWSCNLQVEKGPGPKRVRQVPGEKGGRLSRHQWSFWLFYWVVPFYYTGKWNYWEVGFLKDQ